MSIRRDTGNRAKGNLAQGWGEIHLTGDTASDFDYVNYHFLKPLAYLLLAPPHFAFVHAACIARNGRAIVLCGDATAGKTCLAFACARKGWTFLSGDATHLLHYSSLHQPGLHQPGEFSVAGRPFSIRFRESARELFPELNAQPAKVRPNLKPSIEVDTRKLNLSTALRARVDHFVFLDRRPDGPARMETISGDETKRRLDETVFFGDETIRLNQRATLHSFASLPSVRLTYSDLHDAEAKLRGLLPDGV